MYDGYFVYMEDGDLWLGFSEGPFDDGETVDALGDAVDVPSILRAVRRHQRAHATQEESK